MTAVTAAAAGAGASLSVIAAWSGRALRNRRAAAEASLAAVLATIMTVLGGDGVLAGAAFVLGVVAAVRFGWAIAAATKDGPGRLLAELERESAAKSRFVSRALIERLGRRSLAEVVLGDRVTEPMTVLFADIRDSTSLTETLSSEQAFALVAEFFARSARVIRDHRGTVDKYLGDGYMALFPRNVEDALDAALALQHAVALLNAERLGPPISVGIGLHTGPVTFGTVGDARHIDTTVVSDTVNTAKRVEGISKRLGVPVVATESVMQVIREPIRYVLRPLGPQRVRGKRDPIDVFSVSPGIEVRRVTTLGIGQPTEKAEG
ncbi:MAG TPA: adenylate/guanylate cyclase domain-containing protein [Candidatus Limnocylindria bacterium]|jgi:class 3 adenylate cyclase|nr:adenylate/guanylate cyclase domain-containing protein [Candidatus Limnocylindria bacterium]